MPPLDIENYTLAPYDKGIIIVRDGEFEFMTMPEVIIRVFREYDDMAAYLAREDVNEINDGFIPIRRT